MRLCDRARCIEISEEVDRNSDVVPKLLPDGFCRIDQPDSRNGNQKRFLSLVQGRAYNNVFGFVERFITEKILEVNRGSWLKDQGTLSALERFCNEKLEYQELYSRFEPMVGSKVRQVGPSWPGPDEAETVVLEKSTWALLGVILEIQLFTQDHAKQNLEPSEHLPDAHKNAFLFHWKEETSHPIFPRATFVVSPSISFSSQIISQGGFFPQVHARVVLLSARP